MSTAPRGAPPPLERQAVHSGFEEADLQSPDAQRDAHRARAGQNPGALAPCGEALPAGEKKQVPGEEEEGTALMEA